MSGSEMDQAAAGGMVNLFLLNEFRDMRKGMEARDESLRSSIDGVKESVNVLSAKVDRSQNDVDAIKTDMDGMRTDLSAVREEVDSLQKEKDEEKIRSESSWLGPRRIGRTIIYLGSVGGAIFVLIKFWPAVVAALAALAG